MALNIRSRAFRAFCYATSVLLLFLLACSSNREIVDDLDEKEANEIIVFLAAYGIPAQKTAQSTTAAAGESTTRFSIQVPQGQAVEALSILARNGLPRRPGQSLLSIFAKSGLVSSSQEEQIRYQQGLSSQIAGVIRKIDGVLDADVQISFPATEAGVAGGGLPGAEQQAGEVRASVYVKHSGILDDPNSQLVNKIKRLVAGSVVGLTFDNVTVVTDRARFTEVSLETPEQIAEHEYERVWSVYVLRESAGRFRAIFIIFCLIVIVLVLFVGWLIWKLFPLIRRGGGAKALFASWKPLTVQEESRPTPPPEGEE